jgi:hypothetical protein
VSWLDPYFIGVSSVFVNGAAVTKERGLNLIAGSNVTLSFADNPTNARTDVTIAATGGGGSFTALTGDATSTSTGGATAVVGLGTAGGATPSITLGQAGTTTQIALNAASTSVVTAFQIAGVTQAKLVPTGTSNLHAMFYAGGQGTTDAATCIGPLPGNETTYAGIYFMAPNTAPTGAVPGAGAVYAATNGSGINIGASGGAANVNIFCNNFGTQLGQFGTGASYISNGPGAAKFNLNANVATLSAAAFAPGTNTITPVNGANALSAAQSQANLLIVKAGATGAVTLTSATTAAAQQVVTVVNQTSQTVTFQFASGTGVAIPAGTRLTIGSDGTNAI